MERTDFSASRPTARAVTADSRLATGRPTGLRELIMIVDDDKLVNTLVERVLTNEGYSVVTASDGFKALDLYKRFQPQIRLVILDLNMPGMDGITLFDELRRLDQQVVALLTTGFIEKSRLDKMLANGLRGYLEKPLGQAKLLLEVRKTLDAVLDEARKVPGHHASNLGTGTRP